MDSDMKSINVLITHCANRTQEIYAIKLFGEVRHYGLSTLDAVELVLEDLFTEEEG